ncbi:MAG: hypothetical protein SOW55_04790 [Bacilli bacterium]|nr:hypothetical protein [Bacilli bacterium]
MKKKFGLFALCIASLSTIALTSCNKVSSEQQIINTFNIANKTVKTINQTTEIKSGSLLLVEEKTTIDTEKQIREVVTKTANELTADEAYSTFTVTETGYSFERTEFKVKAEMFSSKELLNNTLVGVVENDYVLKVFNLDASVISGSVTVEFKASTLDSGSFVLDSIEIDYVSNNGNDVSILTEYSY